MSESILEISNRHGREMYVIGIEHAIRMVELDGVKALEYLRSKVASEKQSIEAAKHNRFDYTHRKICDDCRDSYEDFIQESNDEARLDSSSEDEQQKQGDI